MSPLRDAIDVWCPTYPRRVTQHQAWAENPSELEAEIIRASGWSPGYVSVYSFPNGHPRDGVVPLIDTMFIDFDIPADGMYRGESIGNEAAWMQDMDRLLQQVRALSGALIDLDKDYYWRGSLSGHKGVHLYLDFETIPAANGSVNQFRLGLRDYADRMVTELEKVIGADLSPWVDVSSADLARLTRLPNTLHEGATHAFGENRYCVPVSIEELSSITPETYKVLTQAPRMVPQRARRHPSPQATKAVTQFVRHAAETPGAGRSSGPINQVSLQQYDDEIANHEIGLDDLPFLFQWKKCLWHYRERPDMFGHGDQSHQMKLATIAELYNAQVPVDVILEFFDSHPEHDRDVTLREIQNVIRYDFHRFQHETIVAKCPAFLDDRCRLCAAAIHGHDHPTISA